MNNYMRRYTPDPACNEFGVRNHHRGLVGSDQARGARHTSYRLQRKLREGNVFTPVCHSVHEGGGSSVSGSGGMCGPIYPRHTHPGYPLNTHTVNKRALCILLECFLVD